MDLWYFYLIQVIVIIIRNSSANGKLQCNMCDVLANWTMFTTDMLYPQDRNLPMENLIDMYCVSSGSSEIFSLNLSDLTASVLEKFNQTSPYAWIIHGFTDSYPGNWRISGKGWMKQSILEWSKNMVNVCAVDWGKLSLAAFNYFVVARRNTVRVSNYLIDVLLRFASFGVDLTKTSIAGHSMGAQISGRIGASLRIRNLTLGHIYGLDPAGPCYTFPCVVSNANRLDSTDATKVQCIHSNIGLIGTTPRCGCEDFYLNWGIVQPGALNPINAHYFATNIFSWTLNRNHQCFSSKRSKLIGIHSKKECGVYHVETYARSPYCPKMVNNILSDISIDVLSYKLYKIKTNI